MAEQREIVESLPLTMKRRILGYMVHALNLPLLALAIYQAYGQLQGNVPLDSYEFIYNVLSIAVILFVSLAIPWWAPVYRSIYAFEVEGFRVNRFMRRSLLIPYLSIERAEVYIREVGEISKDAEDYAKDASANLRKLGFSFKDYTNAENNIVFLMVRRNIYMVSPTKPKAFLKSLKKRAPKLTARIVELNSRGKSVQDLK